MGFLENKNMIITGAGSGATIVLVIPADGGLSSSHPWIFPH